MTYLLLAIFLQAFCMIANRLSQTVITAPQVFLALGFIFASIGMVPEAGSEEALHLGEMWAQNRMEAELFAPEFALLKRVHNKFAFIQLCREARTSLISEMLPQIFLKNEKPVSSP